MANWFDQIREAGRRRAREFFTPKVRSATEMFFTAGRKCFRWGRGPLFVGGGVELKSAGYNFQARMAGERNDPLDVPFRDSAERQAIAAAALYSRRRRRLGIAEPFVLSASPAGYAFLASGEVRLRSPNGSVIEGQMESVDIGKVRDMGATNRVAEQIIDDFALAHLDAAVSHEPVAEQLGDAIRDRVIHDVLTGRYKPAPYRYRPEEGL